MDSPRAEQRASTASGTTPATDELSGETAAFYRATIGALSSAGVPFLVGGAYAFARYTGIKRHTKDLDVFVRPSDVDRALAALAGAGCSTELTFPHWLGKACCGDDFVDVIFSSGNSLAVVDDEWFGHAVEGEVLSLPVRPAPAEEMIWSKAFVMERERYDGADVNHLLRATAASLDWPRLLRRFDEHWRILLSHLILFGYVYPVEARNVPAWVMRELLTRAEAEIDTCEVAERICRGPLISRAQYLVDLDQWGYRDPRLRTNGGAMSGAEVGAWTDAIAEND